MGTFHSKGSIVMTDDEGSFVMFNSSRTKLNNHQPGKVDSTSLLNTVLQCLFIHNKMIGCFNAKGFPANSTAAVH
jgi:hypothetical protein